MSKKILLVDDINKDLNKIKEILEKNGYDVTTASNGAGAFDIFRKDRFDLVLIDILMPTLSGYDLLRLLREKGNHSTKMVYITIVPKKDAHLEDVDGFIQKPFSEESLLEGVKKAI